ncbi:MAG: Fe2+-dependent dioxygenase [Hyphomonadaceae bacterium]|nr:Fe2+-dependent dioxygenase [Hyphomonadaceae bacterium]
MSLLIAEVLDAEELREARELTATLAWRDGAKTAGATARAVKRNLQADLSSRTGAKLRDMLDEAIASHPVLRAAAQPKRFSNLLVSKTEAGGGYGLHVDNAFMGRGEARLRTDLSFTLFLSAPETYSGGELMVELAGMQQSFKPAAGDLVLYPSTSLHQVMPVTEGVRLVCVGWIESAVPDAAARDILFDLENLRASLAMRHEAQSPEMLTLAKAISNLLRRFGR